ncbi:MAG: hypothetical protein V1792_02120 [Pseudomonadota bacterium]
MKSRGDPPPFNPFVDVAVGDPWKSAAPDVLSVNREAFAGLVKLVGVLERTPSIAALVLGEAGSGKTHLIKRLISVQGNDLVFVYVHPMKDHRRVFSSLLQVVISALEREPPGGPQQAVKTGLELMAAHVLAAVFEDYLQKHPDDGGRTYLQTVKRRPWKIFSFKNFPKWSPLLAYAPGYLSRHASLRGHTAGTILKVFFHYLDESKREAAVAYLSGSDPDDEGAGLLGIKPTEGDFTVEAQEDRSKQILKTLGSLLTFYRPMILCFDQLENLDTEPLIASFGRLINDIVNEVDNVLPVGFVRAETWDVRMAPHLDAASKGRISSNVFHLKGLKREEAMEIVRARLDWAYSSESRPRPGDFHPLQRAELERRLLGLTSPRDVLIEANRMFREATLEDFPPVLPEDPLRILLDSFDAERGRLVTDQEKESARKDVLVAAFRLLLMNRDRGRGYQVLTVDTGEPVDLTVRIAQTGKESAVRTVDLVVETANHWNPLQKSLNLLRKRIEAGRSQTAVLVRDERRKIPPKKGGMPKTVQALKSLEAVGGRVIYLEYLLLADLYALVYTSDKVGSRDLTYIAEPTGERGPVDEAMFRSFVRDVFHSGILEKMDDAFMGETRTDL